jgi:hypothetical protein
VQADEAGSEKAYVYGPVPFGLELANANINAQTGLATDYLNHFNEAIMLFEMAGKAPDCIDEIRRWQPMSYREHFLESRLKARELAIAAYAGADPTARASLDNLALTMTSVIETTRDRLSEDLPPQAIGDVAARAAIWLRQLVARAGAVINGAIDIEQIDAPQVNVDRLMRHG